jgi:hypothetical protein
MSIEADLHEANRLNEEALLLSKEAFFHLGKWQEAVEQSKGREVIANERLLYETKQALWMDAQERIGTLLRGK